MSVEVRAEESSRKQPVTPELNGSDRPRPRSGERQVSEAIGPLFRRLFGGEPPIRFEFWDGSSLGPTAGDARAVVRSPDALKRMLWAPGELGLARAYVSGDLDVETGGRKDSASLLRVLRQLDTAVRARVPGLLETVSPLLSAARELGLVWPPPPPPGVEVRLSSRWRPKSLHTEARDSEAVRHHYDIGNDFYELVLGPSMTYSCARFESPTATLEEAQASKHELICRKLGFAEQASTVRRRLLDVGCGWGSMAMHAASRYGVDAVGVTLSPNQLALAKERVREAALEDHVEIRLQDYRELSGESFDAISSVGMFEHVGMRRMGEYFSALYRLLKPQGRMVNHAISKPGGSRMKGRTFMNRYVFPDGELLDVGEVVLGMERAGFEVRDVESLREHYARTLRCWLENLARRWDEAVELVGVERARAWRLYMSGSVNAFEQGRIAVHQVLGVKTAGDGTSGMPATRSRWA